MRYLVCLALVGCAAETSAHVGQFVQANPHQCKQDERGKVVWINLGQQLASDEAVREFAQVKTLKELRIH